MRLASDRAGDEVLGMGLGSDKAGGETDLRQGQEPIQLQVSLCLKAVCNRGQCVHLPHKCSPFGLYCYQLVDFQLQALWANTSPLKVCSLNLHSISHL